MTKTSPNPPGHGNSASDHAQTAKNQAAKQHDKESPEDRGQTANTRINTTHQGGVQHPK